MQPWMIDLVDLKRIGWSAAAAADWAYRRLTPPQAEVLENVWAFCDERTTTWEQDPHRAFVEISGYLRGASGHPTGLVVDWHDLGGPYFWRVEFSLVNASAEPLPGSDVRLLRWRTRIGRQGTAQFLEFLIEHQVGARPLTVRVHPRNKKRGEEDELADWGSFPWHVKMARRAREYERRRLQAHDASEPAPIVLIHGGWEAGHLAESVMAQLIEWHYRIRDVSPPNAQNCPGPAADALEWWIHWVQTAAADSGKNLGFPEALAVARRSVRPAHAAGHRMYWRDSLRPRGRDGPVERASRLLGIGRSTAYQRLKTHSQRASDFRSINDLADFLRKTEPARRLEVGRREIIKLLTEAGMNPESARKFEQRIRTRPKKEQLLRLEDKLDELNRPGHHT